MPNFLDDLNDEQLAAIKETEGHIRLLAGAGTGKTRALTYRYAYLVSMLGISPRSVLCVTFTNKAAMEMKTRIMGLCGNSIAPLITTFHGYCASFLKDYANRLNYSKDFYIIDTGEKKRKLTEIFSKLEIKGEDISQREALALLSKKKEQLSYIDLLVNSTATDLFALSEKAIGPSLENAIFYYYLGLQKTNYGLDFDDLINFTLRILESDFELCEKIASQHEYIMVDEFQDIDLQQWTLIKHLCSYHNNLFVVGDPDQTIYSFRGANVSYFIDFDRTYPGSKLFHLVKNYRSTSNILYCAYTLISNNIYADRRRPEAMSKSTTLDDMVVAYDPILEEEKREAHKNLHYFDAYTAQLHESQRKQDDPRLRFKTLNPVVVNCEDPVQESQYIALTVKKILKRNEFSTIAVLMRANMLSKAIENAFMQNKIRYNVVSSVKFFDRKEVKDVCAYLRLIVNHDDNEAFSRIVNVPARGFGKSRMQKLDKIARTYGLSYFSTLEKILDGSLQVGAHNLALVEVKKFVDIVNDCKDIRNLEPIRGIERILSTFGYEQSLIDLGEEDRLDNLVTLRALATDYGNKQEENANVFDFFTALSLYNANDEVGDDTGCVQVMTIHNSKGLEFDYVFVMGLNEGVFPSKRAQNAEQVAEERRLMYVAMTRARKQLFMTIPGGEFSKEQERKCSRFISELDENEIYEIGEPVARASLNDNEENTRDYAFKVGDRVYSPILGKGVIRFVDEINAEYKVFFDAIKKERTMSFMAALERDMDAPIDSQVNQGSTPNANIYASYHETRATTANSNTARYTNQRANFSHRPIRDNTYQESSPRMYFDNGALNSSSFNGHASQSNTRNGYSHNAFAGSDNQSYPQGQSFNGKQRPSQSFDNRGTNSNFANSSNSVTTRVNRVSRVSDYQRNINSSADSNIYQRYLNENSANVSNGYKSYNTQNIQNGHTGRVNNYYHQNTQVKTPNQGSNTAIYGNRYHDNNDSNIYQNSNKRAKDNQFTRDADVHPLQGQMQDQGQNPEQNKGQAQSKYQRQSPNQGFVNDSVQQERNVDNLYSTHYSYTQDDSFEDIYSKENAFNNMDEEAFNTNTTGFDNIYKNATVNNSANKDKENSLVSANYATDSKDNRTEIQDNILNVGVKVEAETTTQGNALNANLINEQETQALQDLQNKGLEGQTLQASSDDENSRILDKLSKTYASKLQVDKRQRCDRPFADIRRIREERYARRHGHKLGENGDKDKSRFKEKLESKTESLEFDDDFI